MRLESLIKVMGWAGSVPNVGFYALNSTGKLPASSKIYSFS